jgi:hypothetical protein
MLYYVHFFAEPGPKPDAFDDWITCWKRGVGRLLKNLIADGKPDHFIIASARPVERLATNARPALVPLDKAQLL